MRTDTFLKTSSQIETHCVGKSDEETEGRPVILIHREHRRQQSPPCGEYGRVVHREGIAPPR